MKKLKKILFPFYNLERHSFLMSRWWFRLLAVLYPIGLLAYLGFVFSSNADNSWCYRIGLSLYDYGSAEYAKQLANCVELGKEAFWEALGLTAILALFIHYLSQFIFLKIIINFIVLGNKKTLEQKGGEKIPTKNHLSIPVAIVIGCLILGIFIYITQTNKQKSIEKKQKIEQEKEVLALKREECNSLSSGLIKRWNNVIGVKYDDEFWKECVVTYSDTKTGEIQTSPLRLMENSK